MAGKIPSKEELKAAVSKYCEKHPNISSEWKEEAQQWTLKDSNGIEIYVMVDGEKMISNSDGVQMALCEIITNAREEAAPQEPARASRTEVRQEKAMIPAKPRNGQGEQMVKPQCMRDVQVSDLTMDDIRGYICPEATEQEAFMFLKLCQARNLNPFTREAYLVKYGGKANMIVGKEAFTRKAEMHPEFDGFSAGIIVRQKDGTFADLPGTFYDDSEDKLVGGWAEVCRKDRKTSFVARVSLKEYSKAQATWKDMPCVMIRKVALVTALREAFPSDLSGCYDAAEVEMGAA